MARERFIVEDNSWQSFSDFDQIEVSEQIHSQVGARFPIQWRGNRVIIDFNDLPSEVSENDVKQAVRDNHPHR